MILGHAFVSLGGSDREEDSGRTLRNVLATFYPELFHKGWYLEVNSFQPIDSDWKQVYETTFKVTDGAPVAGNPTISLSTGRALPAEAEVKLNGYFQVDRENEIENFWVWGDQIINSGKNEEVRMQVESHPDWSESDAFRALKDAGALYYGPSEKEALLKMVRLQEFDRFLGHVTIRSATFNGFANPNHAGNYALLFWTIEVETSLANGARRNYALAFEPFNGRLIGIQHLR
jgi:hypothetical protein